MNKVIQTYLQGGRHKSNGAPCEDRTYSLSQNGVDVIALADGAGSKQYTHAAQGAECSTKAICEFLCNKFDEVYETDDNQLLQHVVMTVCHKELQKKADELKLDSIIRLSSTLLCVAIKGNKAILIHIGDGVIGCLSKDKIKVVSEPENGEFASTTYFITLPQANEYLHIDKFIVDDNDAVFFLMSDGTADYCYDDFNNTFKSGAGKLAMLTFDDGGQDKLCDIVQTMLVDNDPVSDDCSFIAIRVSDSKPDESALTNTNIIVKLDDENLDDIYEDEEMNKQIEKKLNVLTFLSIIAIALSVITMALSVFNIVANKDTSESIEAPNEVVAENVETEKEETNTIADVMSTTKEETTIKNENEPSFDDSEKASLNEKVSTANDASVANDNRIETSTTSNIE